jgi:hypothetical protein
MIFSQFCDVAITGNHLQVELTKFGYNLDLESFVLIWRSWNFFPPKDVFPLNFVMKPHCQKSKKWISQNWLQELAKIFYKLELEPVV